MQGEPGNGGISYRPDFKLWWPDYDHSPENCFRCVKRGLADMDYAIGLCRRRDVCVQAGGHVGLWPIRLAARFGIVHTFECEPVLFRALSRNVDGLKNIRMYPSALGAESAMVMMRGSVSAGSWRIDPAGKFPVQQVTIDALDLNACDAIFLDIEGYEAEALRGAANTIERFRPVLHVEELPRSKIAIRSHMKSIGYRLVKQIHSDFVYVG